MLKLITYSCSYRPLRPLKSTSTVLFRRELVKTRKWPYAVPVMVSLLNNLLVGFTTLNSGIMCAVGAGCWAIYDRNQRIRALQILQFRTDESFQQFQVKVLDHPFNSLIGYRINNQPLVTVTFNRDDIKQIWNQQVIDEEEKNAGLKTFEQVKESKVGLRIQLKELKQPQLFYIDMGENKEINHEDYLLALITNKNIV